MTVDSASVAGNGKPALVQRFMSYGDFYCNSFLLEKL